MQTLWFMLSACSAPSEPSLAPPELVVEQVVEPTETVPSPEITPASVRTLVAHDCEPCDLPQRVDHALIKLAPFLADWPGDRRFDAAIAVHEIREVVDHPDLVRAWAINRPIADRDDDHPHRRLWVEFEPAEPTNRWTMPTDRKPSVNNLISEAIWCDRFPIRPEVLQYYSTDMLDDGGYWSTHAGWALALVKERDCIDDERFAELSAPILADVLRHQPRVLAPETVADVDLFAERLNALIWLGHRGPEIDASVEQLLLLQLDDGSWGEPTEEQTPYYGYHAAFVSGWALTEWIRVQPQE